MSIEYLANEEAAIDAWVDYELPFLVVERGRCDPVRLSAALHHAFNAGFVAGRRAAQSDAEEEGRTDH